MNPENPKTYRINSSGKWRNTKVPKTVLKIESNSGCGYGKPPSTNLDIGHSNPENPKVKDIGGGVIVGGFVMKNNPENPSANPSTCPNCILLHERIDCLQKVCIVLQEKIDSLKSQNEKLEAELKDYKETYDPVKSGLRQDEVHCACAYELKKSNSTLLSLVREAAKALKLVNNDGEWDYMFDDTQASVSETLSLIEKSGVLR